MFHRYFHFKLLIGLFVLLVTGSCAQKNQNNTPQEELFTFEARSGETVEAYRGSLEVPENRANPDSRMITLKYIRFPSTGDNPGSPIVILGGGPGQPGTRMASGPHFEMFMALRDAGDVIAFDQRGSGTSNDMPNCETEIRFPFDRPGTLDVVMPLYKQAAAECVIFWANEGIDIKGYTVVENARDLDALRNHLGVEKLNLWAISWGGQLAIAATKVMDDRLDKMVLSNFLGLEQSVRLPVRTDAYFDRLQAAINQDPDAKALFPDVKAMMQKVHDRLSKNPAMVKLELDNGEMVEFVYGKDDLQRLSSFAPINTWSAVWLMHRYRELDTGDYDAVAFQIYVYFRANPITLATMPTIMEIASGISPERLALFEEQFSDSIIGPWHSLELPYLISAFGDVDIGEQWRAPSPSKTPTLVISSTLDPRTYPESHMEAVANFSNVTQVIVENAGHDAEFESPQTLSQDVVRLTVAFFKGERVNTERIVAPLPDFSIE